MIKNLNILVTGIDGYSGSRVKKYLDKFKINSIGVSRRYNKKNIIKWDLVKKNKKNINYKFDWIVHTASIHRLIDFNKEPNYKKEINKKMTENLIYFAKKNNIKNFIFFSTIDISYKKIFTQKKFYNLSKLHSEKILINAYKKKIFEKVIILRVPAILGKGANENFIVNTIKNLKQNRNIFISDRFKYNNFVHIKDLCRLILKILTFCNLKENKKSKFFDIIDCLSSHYIHISKKIKRIKIKINSNSKIFVIEQTRNFKFLKEKKNKYNFKFMKCNDAIKLLF